MIRFRARRLRLVHYRVLRDWYPLARTIEASTGKKADTARKQLKEGIIAANELFEAADFVLSEELSLVDCTLGPLFWRLPVLRYRPGQVRRCRAGLHPAPDFTGAPSRPA